MPNEVMHMAGVSRHPPAATVLVEIQSGERQHRFECPEGGVILHEALRAGVPVAYSCATGQCGTCAASVLEGSVRDLWPQAPGLNPQLRAKGRILTCQSAATQGLSLRCDVNPHAARSTPVTPRYFAGILEQIDWRTHGVAELRVRLDSDLVFLPGQFVLLSLKGLDGARAFSIANSESGPADKLRFFVRPRTGGTLDGLLRARQGAELRVRMFGPVGNAVLDGEAEEHGDILCVAGSTGMATMLPILAKWSRSRRTSSARLVFAVRTANDVFLLEDLAQLFARSTGRFSWLIALSDPGDGDLAKVEALTKGCAEVVAGYAHEAVLALLNRERLNGVAFVAGPKPMVQATVRTLVLHGKLSPAAIRTDDFG